VIFWKKKGAKNMKDDCLEEICEEDCLPMFYRTMKFPDGLCDKIKECDNQKNKALRRIINRKHNTSTDGVRRWII
jgi:hypothetical protein